MNCLLKISFLDPKIRQASMTKINFCHMLNYNNTSYYYEDPYYKDALDSVGLDSFFKEYGYLKTKFYHHDNNIVYIKSSDISNMKPKLILNFFNDKSFFYKKDLIEISNNKECKKCGHFCLQKLQMCKALENIRCNI